MMWIDARIPVRIVNGAGARGEAVVIEGRDFEAVDAAHAAACACCLGRSPVAMALDRLFQRRARGEVPFFRSVGVVIRSKAGGAELRAALRDDPLVLARFRPDQGTS